MDMAGTVITDGGIVISAFRRALEAVGTTPSEMQHAMRYAMETMGSPKAVVFRHLLGSDQRADVAMDAFAAAINEALAQGGVDEIPGARAALVELRRNGVKVCLTTGFSGEVQDAIVAKLSLHEVIDFWLAPTAAVRGRPYPDMVLTAALKAQVDDVREVAVAGDTTNDLWAGYRAGASIVAGVLTGSHGRAELQSAPHTDILESVRDFPDLILRKLVPTP
jgi:phosphoglycolate phosphatase